MKLLTRFLMLVFAGALMVSCLENDTEDVIQRTEAMELEELSVYLDTLAQRGVDVDTTDLGVYYVVDSLGDGPYPQIGDTCIVKYDGFLLNGVIFDSSASHNEEGTYEFVLDETTFISGWTDGMKQINEGSLVYLIIPSKYAYGAMGTYVIGPYETLLFAIEMVEIKQAY